MSGARKRRGTTLVELSLVIAILAMVVLPFAAFVSQNLKNTVQSSTQLKEQMVLEQVMQDMEKHLRSAIRVKSDGTSCPITFPTGGISFTSSDPQKVVSTRPVQTQYTYVLASGLLTKTVGTNVGVTFPDGLEASLITKLKFWSTTTEPPDAATPEPPDAATPPCYLTVRMEAYNPTLQTTTALQETIYLRNYTLIVDIAKILGVTAPVPGATPTSAIPATSEYTATISWSGSPVTFAAGTPYTATITLTPRGDYTLTGVAANFFTVDGAASVTNPAGSGTTTAIVVTATFPAIGATQLAITAPALTLSKPYDGTTTAAVTAGTLIGVVSPDVVTVTAVATYDTAAVGVGKTITVVYTLGGAQAGNYIEPVNYTVTTGVITAKAIMVTATGPSKAYGTALTAGTSTTNFTAGATGVGSEVITSVTLTPDAAGLSATTAAGAAYVVTPSLATGTGGFLASNYLVTYVAYNGTVGQKALTVTATVGQAKIYGAADPTFTYTSPALETGDAFTGALSRATGENVGTYAFTLGSLTAGSNYTLSIAATPTFSVTAKALTVTATGPTKVYGTALTAGTSTTNFTAGATGVGSEVITSVTLTPDAAGLSATTAAGAAYVVTPSLATGTGGFLASNYLVTYVAYSGTVAAAPITAIGAITGTPQVGQVLTPGALTPSGATATYQWQWSATSGGAYANISGATSNTYTLVAGDATRFIKVVATGTGNYTGTVTSAATTVVTTPLTGIGATAGTTQVGQTLTAGTVTPSGATTTYRWQSATTSGGTYADITGATGTTYTLVAGDLGKYIKVVATGTGNYTGTVTSAAAGAVTPAPIDIAAIPGVTPPVKGATPVTTITATAQYTGTVTWQPNPGNHFTPNKVYTATITLTPIAGYTLTGVAANFFTVAGTTVDATNATNSGVVTAVFPATVP